MICKISQHHHHTAGHKKLHKQTALAKWQKLRQQNVGWWCWKENVFHNNDVSATGVRIIFNSHVPNFCPRGCDDCIYKWRENLSENAEFDPPVQLVAEKAGSPSKTSIRFTLTRKKRKIRPSLHDTWQRKGVTLASVIR